MTLLRLSNTELLDVLAREGPGPAVGSAAALVAATAAALTAKAAKTSTRHWDGAAAAAARAEALLARASPLAQEDADAYAAGQTVAVPARLAEVGAEIASLAADVAEAGNPNLRPDATGAAVLAQAASWTAAFLVDGNVGDPDDERVRTAWAHAAAAGAAVARLV